MTEKIPTAYCEGCPKMEAPLSDLDLPQDGSITPDCPGPTYIINDVTPVTGIDGRVKLRAVSSVGTSIEEVCGREADQPQLSKGPRVIFARPKEAMRFGVRLDAVTAEIVDASPLSGSQLATDTRNDYLLRMRSPRQDTSQFGKLVVAAEAKEEEYGVPQLSADLRALIEDVDSIGLISFTQEGLHAAQVSAINVLGKLMLQPAIDIQHKIRAQHLTFNGIMTAEAQVREYISRYLVAVESHHQQGEASRYPQFVEQMNRARGSHVYAALEGQGISHGLEVAKDAIAQLASYAGELSDYSRSRASWLTLTGVIVHNKHLRQASLIAGLIADNAFDFRTATRKIVEDLERLQL